MEVINPYLYKRLMGAADENGVKVSNQGLAASFCSPPASAGYSRKQAFPMVPRWGEVYHLCCPFCDDSTHRLYFSHLCGAKVKLPGRDRPLRFSKFLCDCKNEKCQAENPGFSAWLDALMPTSGGILDLSSADAVPSRISSQIPGLFTFAPRQLPSPCYPITSGMVPEHAKRYLTTERKVGFDLQTLQDTYGVGYSPKGATYKNAMDETVEMFEERMVVPITFGLHLIGWQARILRETRKGHKDIKYLTSPGMQKQELLYNIDRAILCNFCVIVEGITDVWRVGAPGVCLLGKSISDMHKKILKSGWGTDGGILVMLDPEEHDRTYRTALELDALGFPRGVIAVYLENNDPADWRTPELRSILQQHVGMLRPLKDARKIEMDDDELFRGHEELEEDQE